MENLFESDPDATTIDPEKNYLEELVGEGKKFKTEADLARAKAESDAFIEKLQRENKTLRENQKSTSTLEEIVNQLREDREKQIESTRNHQDPPAESRDPPQTITQEQIEALLDRKLTETISVRDRERTQTQNLSAVEEIASKVFGPNFRQELDRRRQALGLGSDFLTNLAKEQPKAFLKLLDINETSSVDTRSAAPPVNQRPGSGTSPSGQKNWRYYQNLRRTDEKAYQSPSVQMEMFKALQEQGDDFYK